MLKSMADPTRLRLLALMAHGEATVGELQEILQQSQPRVSRHLRLLDEAGLVEKFRDGHWVYYRLAAVSMRASSTVIDALLAQVGHDDEQLTLDRAALDRVKRNRERDVFRGRVRSAAGVVERPTIKKFAAAMDECIGDRRLGDVLDVGCGSGTLLRMLSQRSRRAVGVDRSRRMRMLARSRLHTAGVANGTVRAGDLSSLPFDDDSFDLVMLDEVLDGFDTLSAGLREAARVLHPTGQLLILDCVQPVVRRLSEQRGESRLIENQLTAMLFELGYRVAKRIWFPGRAMEYALFAAVPDKLRLRTGTV